MLILLGKGDLPYRWECWSFTLLERAGAKQWANACPGFVAPRDAAFVGITWRLRLEAEKLRNFLALCISLFSLQHL